ncbi:hypothetical protein [Phaeocystidibacter marisrubri]|uniref:Uncharacterized protein n=1 Tax=Phaeocystidibacter marisrubri TaxID=1577780 RepID=A0A6L3ZE51_9FLAO|nr:hypothetical protein [Phaeocystidibacter marisrubri]KAB2816105.1 hypothetical protein F8C82_10465 [Phaeocystidibacter marisrubri]GGH67352.1 hypothetical protein GCM10011318_06240 [Phaeocystidibacter marisrubri]
MPTLNQQLTTPQGSLQDFADLTVRVLGHLPNVVSGRIADGNYEIWTQVVTNTTTYIRPVNVSLFEQDPTEFKLLFSDFLITLDRLDRSTIGTFTAHDHKVVNRTLYTIQQSLGVGMDLLINPNAARKHVGNRFEELMRCVFDEVRISNSHTVLKIPYGASKSEEYSCENDAIISSASSVRSTNSTIHPDEVVVSIKTSSKDRMGKMFIDKMLLERFVEHPVKVIGIFLNDVQRKGVNKVSYTLVSKQFMVYSKFLTQLEGVYYLDPPSSALRRPWNQHMKKVSNLLLDDLFRLLK